MVVYLDDMRFMNPGSSAMQKELSFVSQVLEALGFVINKDKSVFNLRQIIELLGVT